MDKAEVGIMALPYDVFEMVVARFRSCHDAISFLCSCSKACEVVKGASLFWERVLLSSYPFPSLPYSLRKRDMYSVWSRRILLPVPVDEWNVFPRIKDYVFGEKTGSRLREGWDLLFCLRLPWKEEEEVFLVEKFDSPTYTFQVILPKILDVWMLIFPEENEDKKPAFKCYARKGMKSYILFDSYMEAGYFDFDIGTVVKESGKADSTCLGIQASVAPMWAFRSGDEEYEEESEDAKIVDFNVTFYAYDPLTNNVKMSIEAADLFLDVVCK